MAARSPLERPTPEQIEEIGREFGQLAELAGAVSSSG
jgi:hypothetical protein